MVSVPVPEALPSIEILDIIVHPLAKEYYPPQAISNIVPMLQDKILADHLVTHAKQHRCL
jgi:hypothetical protein